VRGGGVPRAHLSRRVPGGPPQCEVARQRGLRPLRCYLGYVLPLSCSSLSPYRIALACVEIVTWGSPIRSPPACGRCRGRRCCTWIALGRRKGRCCPMLFERWRLELGLPLREIKCGSFDEIVRFRWENRFIKIMPLIPDLVVGASFRFKRNPDLI
jgi:hypothetical protein